MKEINKESHIKNTIDGIIGGLKKKHTTAGTEQIIEAWRECAGADIKKTTAIEKINEGILYLKTNSPARIYEMKINKKSLLEKINKKIEKKTLQDIKIKLGDI